MNARQGLLLLIAITAAWSVYLAAMAATETYQNVLFASPEPGGGISTSGIVDHISEGARSRMGQRVDILQVRYRVGPSDLPRTFSEPVSAGESFSRSVHPGDTIALRVWGDGPELARVNVPGETARYEAQARDHGVAALAALGASIFSAWGYFRFRKRMSL